MFQTTNQYWFLRPPISFRLKAGIYIFTFCVFQASPKDLHVNLQDLHRSSETIGCFLRI